MPDPAYRPVVRENVHTGAVGRNVHAFAPAARETVCGLTAFPDEAAVQLSVEPDGTPITCFRCQTGRFVETDGGRADAGFRGDADDCVCRAIAIVSGRDYRSVYDDLANLNYRIGGKRGKPGERSARNGVARKVYDAYLDSLGFAWTPTMQIGAGCTVHLRADELPAGRLVVRLSGHLTAVVDGVIHDTYDPSRDGTRCVYGYWRRDA